MSQQAINGYNVMHQHGVITLTRDGAVLRFTTGEFDPIRQIVNISLSMESLPALPPEINNGRFIVQFNEDNTLGLSAIDTGNGRDGVLKFTWSEGDDLILTLDAAQAIAINELKMGTML